MSETNLFNVYMRTRANLYETILPNQVEHSMVSEANWIVRSQLRSGEEIGIRVKPGDICYLDFGQAYQCEMGFQHFGLILSVCEKKALVIPMTSNRKTYASAYDPKKNPNGKKNLFELGEVGKMNKPSVLFLNDLKFINTARVIEVMGHIDVKSEQFRKIQIAVMRVIFQQC